MLVAPSWDGGATRWAGERERSSIGWLAATPASVPGTRTQDVSIASER